MPLTLKRHVPLTWNLEASEEMEPQPGHSGGVNDGGVLCQLPLSTRGHFLVVGLASPHEVLPRLGADVSPTAAKEHLLQQRPEPQPGSFACAESPNQVCIRAAAPRTSPALHGIPQNPL